ncbi:MAG: DUF2339 domain-containing protein [Clostridia bacterium]|nr:DUF2339 domain-containing protein [Clostridia bacterium]
MEDNRLERIEQSLQRLEKIVEQQQKEIEMLKFNMAQPTQPQQQVPLQQQIQQVPPLQQQIQQMPPLPPQPVPQINPADYGLGSNINGSRAINHKNVENKIGTSMGIIASILVFISIVLFVTLVYSSLTDVIKVICIFTFSFAVLAAGTFMMHKKMNVFTMSVTGCGMGSVFLSLFVTHVYFGMIDKFVLYLLIMLWAGLVYFFFSKKSYAFKVIGQSGITISVLFGCYSLNMAYAGTKDWWSQYIFLFAFFIIISVFYLLVKRENTVQKAAPLVILDYISVTALAATGINNTSSGIFTIVIVTALYMFFLLYAYVFMAEQNNQIQSLGSIYLVMSVYTCIIIFNMMEALDFEHDGWVMFVLRVSVLAAAFVAEIIRGYKKADNDIIHILMTVILYILLLMRTSEFEMLYSFTGAGIYILPMLAVSYFFKDKTALRLSYATMFLFAVSNGEYLIINVILAILSIMVSFIMLLYDEKMYTEGLKCWWYLASLLLITVYFSRVADGLDLRFSLNMAWTYILAASINAVAPHIGLARDWSGQNSGKEQKILSVTGVLNFIFMMMGLGFLDNNYDWWLGMLMLIVVAGVYITNISVMYKKYREKAWAGIYTGLKLSLFVWIALRAYSLSGPYVSIGWLVLAIILIFAGFKWQYTYLRLYGLFLSMFAIVKLLAFDISYDTGVVRALSFLISGILCFVINLIYNKFSKMAEDEAGK